MRVRATMLAICVLSLSVVMALPVRAQVTVAPAYRGLDTWGVPQFPTQIWPQGYFIWTDEQGFHVRWTSAQGQTRRFRGQATAQGTIQYFQPAYPERGIARQRGNKVVWNASNAGGGDGFDFTVNQGEVVQFNLLIDGRMALLEEIFLGARAYHPSTNPLALAMRTPVGVAPGRPGYPQRPVAPQLDTWGVPQFPTQIWPQGYFIWTNEQGFHVRWTSAQGQTHRFHGQATVQGTIQYFQPAYPERGIARQQGNSVVWNASNAGGGDGFDFAVNQGDVVQFNLLIDGRMVTSQEIYLGASGLHPQQNPFSI